MPYKLVSEHEDGATLKQIAAEKEIDFSRGEGFYELIKKEKVSASKNLVIFKNGKFLSDDSANVKALCGLAGNGDLNIEPKHIPADHQLFVQSTSPNRKIPEDASVLFVVDDLGDDEENENEGGEDEGEEDGDEPSSKKQKSDGKKWAIKFDKLTEMMQGEMGDDPTELTNVKTGKLFDKVDERVPEKIQKDVTYQLSLLFQVEWDETSFTYEIEDDDCYGVPEYYARMSATGTLKPSGGEEVQVRIQYDSDSEDGAWRYFAASVGSKWGIISGSNGDHPFIWSNEIRYLCSDGSTSEDFPSILPEGARAGAKINAVINHGIKWFLYNATYN